VSLTRPLVISIASGKGGTGKTTVAMNLARMASESHRVQILDCDVEEPNCHLFAEPDVETKEGVYVPTPSVNADTCSHCSLCAKVCAFHAIVAGPRGVVVLKELCHGCGACVALCPTHSLVDQQRNIGSVRSGPSRSCPGVSLTYGSLEPGEALAAVVISAVRKRASSNADLILIDSPPGTSCGMVRSVNGSDFCLLVTEPTPLGLHDLELAWETATKLGIRTGVVINRAGAARTDAKGFCEQRGIPVLLEIPLDRRVAEAYAKGQIIVDVLPDCKEGFRDLVHSIVAYGGAQR